MVKQGHFLGWETAMQMDTRWNRLLYSWSPEMLKFYLKTTQDTLPSPANLKTWNKHPLGHSSLCGYSGIARGAGGNCPPQAETLPSLVPQMKFNFVQRSMESGHFESQSAPPLTPEPPLPPPHFEKSGYVPVWLQLLHNDIYSIAASTP